MVPLCFMNTKTRETREGWPLLTVETEAMGTLGVHMKGVLPWFVRWARRAEIKNYPERGLNK